VRIDMAGVIRKLLLTGLISTAVAPLSLAADSLPQPDAPFAGKMALSVKASVPGWPQPIMAPKGAPNVVLILLDDVGFGASSTFGGPSQTPELDELAAQGLRYNRFHVTAMCSPTRAALLSGRNAHNVGFGTVADLASGFPGYNATWRKDAVTVADVLRRNGYSTAAFGKWHNTPFWEISPVGPFDRWPTGLGFESFYGFMSGGESQWEPSLYRNTTPVEPPATPQQGYHFTTDITDQAIAWLHTHESLAPDKPYFLYFAPGATHEPHHVPKEWIEKYRGQFDQGWDKLRAETFARQRKLGVIPANADLTPRPKELPAWNSLSAAQKRFLARQMEVYAGFLSQTDYEVGRLVKAVQQDPHGDNTLILYIVGDNGASGEGGLEGHDGFEGGPPTRKKADPRERLSHIDGLGSVLYMNNYAAAWAWAMDTPFQWMKQVASHLGGTRDPLVVVWPARIKDHGALRSQFTDVDDVAPTIYEVTRIQFPAVVDGVKQQPLDGTSFAYSFDDPTAPSRHRTQIFEQVGNRAIYQDGWVAAACHWLPWDWPYKGDDFDKDRWELYHLDADFSEAHDLAARYPQKLKELQAVFDAEAQRNNIYPLGAGGWDFGLKMQPSPVAGRKEFVFYPGLPRTPSGFVLPNFARSHRITAAVVIPPTGADGVIVADGSRYGGFALYVKDNQLVYENHSLARHDMITSAVPLPLGQLVVAYEFVRDEAKATQDKDAGRDNGQGTGRLYINGQLVAEARQGPVQAWGSFGIGQEFGSPVSSAFQPPFKFRGTLNKVTVELK
jgi:arylsulfatase A-like enzyme